MILIPYTINNTIERDNSAYIDLVYRASPKHSLICLIPTFNWVWISNFFLVATTGQGNSKSADKWIPAIAILTSGVGLVFDRVYGVSLY